ncbi:TRAP transporter permease [Dysosmobacter sp.]
MSELEVKKSQTDVTKKIVWVIAILMSVSTIYNLGFAPMETWTYRILYVSFCVIIISLTKGIATKYKPLNAAVNWLVVALMVGTSLYLVLNLNRLIMEIQFAPTQMDVVICCIGVFLVLLATYETNGLVMPLLAGIFLTYCWWGRYLPGALGIKGYSFNRVMATCYSTDGVFGTSIGVSSTYVILFCIFGAFLEGTGGVKLFIDISSALMGRFRGGAAKVSIIASALMGMINGSAAANTVTTGAFTIPLMKKSNYEPTYAAAVCAVASTGGQIMPPIMGAAAFIMAENVGMPYGEIALAAMIPALLYYMSLFLSVDHESVRLNMTGMSREQLPQVKAVMREVGHLSLSLIVLIVMLVVFKTAAIKAGLYASYTALVVALLKKNTRYGWKKLLDMLANGGKSVVGVASACACAGVITGVLSLTGLGGKIANVILAVAQGKLLLAMIMVMLVCTILGMGLPTTASYIIASSVTAGPLITLGLSPLVANMFIFYYACLSAITPPVAIAAYGAAGIADCNASRAGFKAWWLGLVAFIVPYMFTFSPELLLVSDRGPLYVLYCVFTSCVGIWFFSYFICGFFLGKKLSIFIRLLMLVGSLCMVAAGLMTDILGLALIAACIAYQKFVEKRPAETAAAQ